LPYEFELLLRGSWDVFTSEKVHKLCDNKLCTVTLIKVNGTEESEDIILQYEKIHVKVNLVEPKMVLCFLLKIKIAAKIQL
jgi:hypothetical protein